LAEPWQAGSTALVFGDVGWAWSATAPRFEVPEVDPVDAVEVEGWGLDHVVLLVPEMDAAVDVMAGLGVTPRLRMEVKRRPTCFFRVGPVLEIIESPVRVPALYGVALVTDEPLEAVVLRWRSSGREVSDPKPAMQPGRRIFTVRDLEAGLAVMSSNRAVQDPES
jgi:hypothetical protein